MSGGAADGADGDDAGARRGAARLILDRFLPYRLSVTSNAISELIAGDYRGRFDLTIPQWRVIAVLGQDDPGHGPHAARRQMTQRGLGRATRMDKVTISRAVAVLGERALIERGPAPGDARAMLVRLSDTGIAMFEAIAPAALAIEAELMAALTPAERAVAGPLLDRLLALVEERQGGSGPPS